MNRRRSDLTDADRKLFEDFISTLRSQPKKPKDFLGIPIPQVILCCFFLGGMYATFGNMRGQVEGLMVFQKNSDGFHSTITGTQFEEGKPIDGHYANPKELSEDLRKRLSNRIY